MSYETLKPSPIAGALLLGATLLEVIGMAHHPSVHTPDVAAAIQQISRLGQLSGWVHGVIATAMLCIAYGLMEFALRRGWSRPWIRAGSIALATGVLVMIGAGLVSGFILPDLIALTPHVSALDLAINAQLLVLCRVLNQSCANFATVATCAGILCWSIDLLRERGGLRVLSLLGMFVGILPALALIFGSLQLNVHGMSEVVWGWALWHAGVAVSLIRPIHREVASSIAPAASLR
jgi:hypothetical protein